MIGKTLDHYRVTARIGHGGMGEVYRAHDTRLGRDVAIKVLPAEVAQDPDRQQRFAREARAVAALSHPHIVAIVDFGRYVSPYGIGSIYACLGETESALDWLEKAHAEHDQTLVWVKVHPRLDGLRDHARFRALLTRMRL